MTASRAVDWTVERQCSSRYRFIVSVCCQYRAWYCRSCSVVVCLWAVCGEETPGLLLPPPNAPFFDEAVVEPEVAEERREEEAATGVDFAVERV